MMYQRRLMGYAEAQKHPADFEVTYRFYTPEEGGRSTGPPWQHIRCDWAYDGDDDLPPTVYMIWPEFVGEDSFALAKGSPVPWSGVATMWIVVPKMRAAIHRGRIREGVHGFFMEGALRTAEAVVTRILGLHTNPAE